MSELMQERGFEDRGEYYLHGLQMIVRFKASSKIRFALVFFFV